MKRKDRLRIFGETEGVIPLPLRLNLSVGDVRPGGLLVGLIVEDSINVGDFYIRAFAQPLVVPSAAELTSVGHRLWHKVDGWTFDMFDELRESIERDRPWFDRFASLSEFLDWAGQPEVVNAVPKRYRSFPLIKLGREKEALPLLEAELQDYDPTFDWHREEIERVESLIQLVTKDPDQARQRLSEWENDTRSNIGVPCQD